LPLLALLKRIRAPHRAEGHALGAYRVHVLDLARRVGDVCEAWDGLRQFEPDNARLANMAAVNRWELLRLLRQLQRRRAPRMVRSLHRDLSDALSDAARAWQLLANGYRFYKSEAVCDGQALLVDAAAAVQGISQELQARWGPSVLQR
jgi:hypothetical protein